MGESSSLKDFLDSWTWAYLLTYPREIISQLNTRFGTGEDDRPGLGKDHGEDMSILDKMKMWGSKSHHKFQDAQPQQSELFQGIEEDDDIEAEEDEAQDATTRSQVASYSKIILGSEAYIWLLSAFAKQSSFHWDAEQPNIMLDQVRETILQRLPTGTISRSKPPRTFSVRFTLPYRPLRTRIVDEKAKRWAAVGLPSVQNLLALTCTSNDEVQVSTIEQYVKQTWPRGSVEILGPLDSLLRGSVIIARPPGNYFFNLPSRSD